MYHQLAHLYDWPGTLDFAEKIWPRVMAALENTGVPSDAQILDLACGTGTLALKLAVAGYRVIGLDVSEAMLMQARSKPGSDGVLWLCGDMRQFHLDTPVDALLCLYDSLNHLSNETELRSAFIHVSQNLKPGGLLVFDINTLENYETFWNGRDSDEGPNYRLRTESGFNPDSGKATVRFEVDEHTEDGLVSRSEVLHEQYFNEVAVEKYLMAAGFVDIRHEPFNPVDDLPGGFSLKTFWTARKSA